jgi:hypothetical protein
VRFDCTSAVKVLLGDYMIMRKHIIPITAASLLFGCATRSTEPSQISVSEFKSQYRLGHNQTMMDSEYLGQKDGRAYLRIRSMSLSNPKQWSEQIAYVELSDLDKQFLDALPPKEYEQP